MNEYLQYIFDTFIYTIIDAIALGVGITVLIKTITLISPLKDLEKIKENSITMVIIWAIILIIFGAFTIAGYFVP